MATRPLLLAILFGCLAPACAVGPSSGETTVRSPTLDYPEPPVETSDGHVVGADGMRVEDKLHTSPRIGAEGVTPSERPARRAQPRPDTETSFPGDPICKVLGATDAVLLTRCPPIAKSKP
jgi:hypothetical protein